MRFLSFYLHITAKTLKVILRRKFRIKQRSDFSKKKISLIYENRFEHLWVSDFLSLPLKGYIFDLTFWVAVYTTRADTIIPHFKIDKILVKMAVGIQWRIISFLLSSFTSFILFLYSFQNFVSFPPFSLKEFNYIICRLLAQFKHRTVTCVKTLTG